MTKPEKLRIAMHLYFAAFEEYERRQRLGVHRDPFGGGAVLARELTFVVPIVMHVKDASLPQVGPGEWYYDVVEELGVWYVKQAYTRELLNEQTIGYRASELMQAFLERARSAA